MRVLNNANFLLLGPAGENESYIIPTQNLDLQTVQVRVYADPSTTFYDVYTEISDVVSIGQDSRIFVVKETPNGQYELTFGNGARLGKFPSAGNKIEVIYDAVAGPNANGGRTFIPVDTVTDGEGNNLTLNVVTVTGSMAGQEKEPISSIRKNAPYLYATQNRMVTASDYSSLVLRKFSNVISDIKSWGGEDNVPPQYGTVFLSIVFNTENADIIEQTKKDIISLAKNLSVASFSISFTDPNTTYLVVDTKFQWNPNLTSSSQTAIEQIVKDTVINYFDAQLGGFDKSFRRSNLLTLIDDADPSILSSRANVRMQYRFIPSVGISNYTIQFPSSIETSNTTSHSITSDSFNISGKVGTFRNRLGSSVIEIIDISTGKNISDNVGEYNASTGTITLSSFTGSLLSNNANIKITAVPANESTVNALRNNVLNFDATASTTTAIITDSL